MLNRTIQEQGYSYFLTEAQDLLQVIEQNLLSLREERTPAKVHSLMRAAHTLKGAAASVGFESIKTIAHSMEDVFKAFYNPEITIDLDLESLLFEAYECLRLPIAAAIADTNCNDAEVLNRASLVFAQLQTRLGSYYNPDAPIPSSAELGFDITQSIFETGVSERLNQLGNVLATGDAAAIADVLQTQAEVFVGLAESLNLPGFGAIAQAALSAVNAQPEQATTIAQVALADFRQGQAAVLAGDRVRGGEPSVDLQQLAEIAPIQLATEPIQSLIHFGSSQPAVAKFVKTWNQVLKFLNQPIWAKPNNAQQPLKLLPTDFNPASADTGLLDFNGLSAEVEIDDSLSSIPDFPVGLELEEFVNRLNGAEKAIAHPFAEFSGQVNAPQLDLLEQQLGETKEKTLPLGHNLASPSVSQFSKDVAPASTTVRVNLEHLESLSHSVGELLINQHRQALQDDHLQKNIQELLDGLRQHQQTLTKLCDLADRTLVVSEGRRRSYELSSVRTANWSAQASEPYYIEANYKTQNLFDALELDRHSELHVVLQSALKEMVQLEETMEIVDLSVKQSSQSLKKQGRLLSNVRDDLMEARMIPVGNVLNRLPRVLQQLIDAHGKRVNLQIKGTQVLVDKAVADKLFDPLLHLIRNAFDHGIEPPETRLQQGKAEIGEIEICAYQQGNRTVIDIRDDGRGLDFHQICRRGFELGLLASDQPEHFSKAELLNLLFEPEFSTATQVSELSGRGVGLDVVRSQLQSLNGSVIIKSELHQGTTFSLQLPLTLMTARLLVCQVGQAVYAFLSDEIEKILIPQAEQVETLAGRSVFQWQQGQHQYAVPICQLSSLISYSTSLPDLSGGEPSPKGLLRHAAAATLTAVTNPLLLLKWQTGFLGISVDQIIGEQELVIRPAGTTIAPPNYVYGCSILGDGRLTLVIDAIVLANQVLDRRAMSPRVLPKQQPVPLSASGLSSNGKAPESPKAPSSASTLVRQRVLVVDDSVTVRQTLARMLQEVGYQVVQAQDGIEAIAHLQQYRDIQLITCDIEMPRLNGFEFLIRYKQDASLSQAPIIMLTSRSSEKHRQLALQLGATAYLTKPYVEQELLNTIARLVEGRNEWRV
ncbi:response regulator [Oculatella sp. LEGE 06141]|uniref:hybrid sensor histidine kinase/response regulator n=1 Tax=Oculatella sp. LEGE 06141 TaxID=1828648 RepID=UPI00188119F1|nr:response regulator [Oculatella sp. LEGE 06141]MBE9183114.1 response regulator [Oculatella sp. LEGE 06141]